MFYTLPLSPACVPPLNVTSVVKADKRSLAATHSKQEWRMAEIPVLLRTFGEVGSPMNSAKINLGKLA